MKLKLVASLLIGLVAAPVFAHGDHDDHGPTVKPGKQVSKEDPAKPATDAAIEAAKPAAKDEQPAETPKKSAPKTP